MPNFIKNKEYESLYRCPYCGSDDIEASQTSSRYVSLNGNDITEGCWWETESIHCFSCEDDIDGTIYPSAELPDDITVGSLVIYSRSSDERFELQINKIREVESEDSSQRVGYYMAEAPYGLDTRREYVWFTIKEIKEVISYGEVNNG